MNTSIRHDVFAAREAKNNFGQMLDTAQRGPVTIQKKGRNVAVVLAYDIYERLQELDDAYWVARTQVVKEQGAFLDTEESEKFLTDLIHEED